MKKLLYLITLIILISSCRSIEKMVERGDYDSAIIHAADKLAGKKKKKTKHVQGLEEAFLRINQRDLDQIAFLDGSNKPENWESIERLANKIAKRQRHIEPLVPLISKDGYVAHFDFVDTYALITKARKGAADYFYEHGQGLLARAATTGDKKYARQAYEEFSQVIARVHNYKDIHRLLIKAEEAGIVHIKVEVANNSLSYLPAEVNQRLKGLNVNNLNDTWKKFYLTEVSGIEFDNTALLELNEITVSPERESIIRHRDEKRIKDGVKYLRDADGKVKRDSTGKKLTKDKFKKVYAEVSEIQREKAAYVSGYMKIFDAETKAIVSSKPLSVEAVFLDYASTFVGDRRAVCDKDHSRLKSYPEAFPKDFAIIGDATEKLKRSFLSALAHANI